MYTHNHRNVFCLSIGTALFFSVFAVSCTTTPAGPAATLGQAKATLSTEYAARKEVDELRKSVDEGEYSTVIPRLLHTISKYPGTNAGVEARYYLGVAYHKIHSYPDAINVFNEYLRLAPTGKFAGDAHKWVALLTEEYAQKYPSPETLEAQIARLREEVLASPDDAQKQMELADFLWKRGNYVKAGELYAEIVTRWPRFLREQVIHDRMEFMPNGSYIVLSPDEVQRRQVQAQPLECINLASFRSGRDLLTREQLYYAVTGQVVNRSDSVLHGVEVIVTIYGFGNVVYDTTTVAIPRLSPGEIRAFSVRFNNFDNIDNVYRYECVAKFQR